MSRTERAPPGRATQEGSLPPNDSIGEADFHTDIEDDHRERRAVLGLRRGSQSATGAPRPETYSKPLEDAIRYVQYIPKDAHGTLEDAVNQLYH